jgi:hypothetical protein
MTTSVGSDGYYKFTGLTAGTYCVTVPTSTLRPLSTYGWAAWDPNINPDPYRTVTIANDEQRSGVNFLYMDIPG